MVKRVGERIARAAEEFMRESGREADIQGYEWEFNLIDDPKTVNAWCMPGGKVAVYTGILPIAKDETGLAVIIGHEVAHAIAKHGNERMSQAMLVQLGGIGLSIALAQNRRPLDGSFRKHTVSQPRSHTYCLTVGCRRRRRIASGLCSWQKPATTRERPLPSGNG